MTQTRPGFGLEIYSRMGISCITRINGTPRQRDPTLHATCSSFASRQNCNWDGSSSSVMHSWELMQRIMSRNTRGSYYLQLWHGTIGVMVHPTSFSKALC